MPKHWSDSLFKVNADGSILYDFDGHISAQGLDLKGGQGTTQSIIWHRNSDGTAIAQIFGYDDRDGLGAPRDGALYLQSFADADPGVARISLTSKRGLVPLTNRQMGINLEDGKIEVTRQSGALAQQIKLLFDINGNSDFGLAAPPAWTAAVLGANLVAPAGWSPPGYRLFNGSTYFRAGAIQLTAAAALNKVLFNVPAGYRIEKPQVFPVRYFNAATGQFTIIFLANQINGDLTVDSTLLGAAFGAINSVIYVPEMNYAAFA